MIGSKRFLFHRALSATTANSMNVAANVLYAIKVMMNCVRQLYGFVPFEQAGQTLFFINGQESKKGGELHDYYKKGLYKADC